MKGTVKDENSLPLDAASISLVKGTDTAGFKNGASDKNGNFSFSGVPSGNYFIRVTAIGHETLNGPGFTLSPGLKVMDLPVFILKKHNNELQTVAVVSKKPFIEQKSDRIIVNVDASPANAGTSVMDVLEKSPGVSVDKDGNVSLKGQAGGNHHDR